MIVYREVGALQPDTTVLSGAAHGVDTAGAFAALEEGLPLVLVVPTDLYHNYQLVRNPDVQEVIEVEGSYMDRNDRLADEADELIAFPRTAEERVRSGTWATVRRFRQRGKNVRIVPLTN